MMVLTRSRSVGLGVLVVALAASMYLVFAGPSDARPDADGVLEVVVDGFEFEPSQLVLPAGEPVTLVFDNRNDFIHHLTVGRSVVEEDGRAVGFREDLFAEVSAVADPPRAWLPPTGTVDTVTINLPARTTVTLEFTLPEDRVGTWQIGCFVGHDCDTRISPEAQIRVE